MNPLSSGLIGFHFSCFSSRHTQAQSPARAAMMNALEEWYDYEQAVIKALAGILTLFFAGILLHEAGISNPLSDFIYEFYLEPIMGESTGDSGYNMVNTMTYGLVLAMFAVALSGWLRHLGVDASDSTLLALLPFVFWAAFGEVVEDARMFSEPLSALFVSPGVHFQTAAWVVVAGAIGYFVVNGEYEEEERFKRVQVLSTLLIVGQFAIFGLSISESDRVVRDGIDLWPFLLLSVAGMTAPIWLAQSAEKFDHVQRSVYFTGIGGSLVLFGAMVSFMLWRPEESLNLWPLAVVIGAPAVLIYAMVQHGQEAADELAAHGIIAGVLPPRMTEEQYLDSSSKEKDFVESLRSKAVMAYPVAFLPVAGQLLDGLATWIGIDYFGYHEKHVVSAAVIDLFDTAATFTVLKLAIGGIILWFYTLANFEYRQQHLRLLIGLALMIVGMAPGLRDVLRLMLGV